MPYVPGVWVHDVTPVDAAIMNNLEKQYDEAVADAAIDAAAQITAHDVDTGVHGVGGGTVAQVADIATDANLSAAAQASIAASHARSHAIDAASDHSAGTAGDILYAGAAGAWSRLAKGAVNKILKMGADYPGWVDDIVALEFPIGDGTNTITTGIKHGIKVPFSGVWVTWEIGVVVTNGTITFDIWKDTYANFPPADADSICGAALPTIAVSGAKATGDASAWTAVTSGDWIFINVDAVATIKQCTLVLILKKGVS
jgi:hypothetical protein